MKLMKGKLRQVVVAVSLLLVSLILYGAYSLGVGGNRWFSSSVNASLRKAKSGVIPGRIYDRNNNLLAATNAQGQRLYHQDELTRRALVHALGTQDGVVKNGVENFMSYLLYAYDASYFARLSAGISGVPRRGYDLRLSLDAGLSRLIAEQFPAGKSGAVVVMNYRTGELLAMNSFPNADPQNDKNIVALPGKPYLNNATTWRSAPGSTFKVITLAAALKNIPNVMSRSFSCTGALQVGEVLVTDAGQAKHGDLSLEKALAVSCNITFAKLALELGDELLKETAQDFGLDDYLLFSDLVVENSHYPSKNRVGKELAWTGPGQSALAITPLHMCLVAAGIANEGEIMQPKLLLQAVNAQGQGKAAFTPTLYRTALDKQSASVIAAAMRQAVLSGTATRAKVSGLQVAGKTGSAQVDGQENTNAWFIGFIDEKTLPYAVCVVIKDIGEGGRHAAPLAGRIFEYIKQMR